MPIRVDEQGRITSYEDHEALPKDYFGPGDPPVSDPEPEKLPVPEPEPELKPRRSASRATTPKPKAESKPDEHHTPQVTTVTETQGPVQQTRLTMGEPEDAESGGHTGGSGHSSNVPGHSA